MENCLQINSILLVLLMIVCAVQTTIVPKKFKKLKHAESITCRIGAELTVKSKLQCSDRCLRTEKCKAYKYKETRQDNCLLINQNSTAEGGQIFEQEATTAIYEKDSCFPNMCQNLGQCINIDHHYRCNCVDGYYGNHCEEQDDCYPSNNCTNGGTCIDHDRNYTCSCPPSWTGIYCQSCNQESSNDAWTPPIKWNGTCPVLYWSFDNLGDLIIMEGTSQVDFDQIVRGKVSNAMFVNQDRNQWIDLGIHTEACMTRPETCGAAGGAVSLWINLDACSGGIITSVGNENGYTSGSQIFCTSHEAKFHVNLLHGYFSASHPKLTGWTHVVMNYIGPDDGEGIRIYINGTEEGSDTTRVGWSNPAADDRIVVGRQYTDINNYYEHVEVDELLFFNQSLNTVKIEAIYNAA